VGPVDGTFALQVQQQAGEVDHQSLLGRQALHVRAGGYYTYTAEVSFVMTGFILPSYWASEPTYDESIGTLYKWYVNNSVCVPYNIYNCQTALSDSHDPSGVSVGISSAQNTSHDAESLALELEAHTTAMEQAMVGGCLRGSV